LRKAFVQALMDMAGEDERLHLLAGDLGFSLLEPFIEKFPSRFINMGVAEQNMIGVATGLALSGKIVFVYSIANFPTFRCLEQIRNDVCYHNVNVNIVMGGGGLAYGALGITHHATEDMAIMRALPNMTVIAPGDPLEAAGATQACAAWPGPCYLRLGKTSEPVVHETVPSFSIGKAIKVRDGKDAALISTGCMLNNIVQAATLLSGQDVSTRVLSMPTVKPLDRDAVLAAAKDTGVIVTVEEHNIIGGLGSAVAEVLAEAPGLDFRFRRMGVKDTFSHDVGNQEYLLKAHGLSVNDIVGTVLDLKKEGR
jgi:transketolase